MEYTPKYIIIHHSAYVSNDNQFDKINEWHKARGFSISSLGYYVGYHVVIEKDGAMAFAREELERDCDALGHNYDSLSICLAGNFNIYKPTKEQMYTLGKILSEWCNKYGLTENDIYSHNHFAKTDCPGTKLPTNFGAYTYLEYEVHRLADIIAEKDQTQ